VKTLKNKHQTNLRRKVALEAASLLYTSQEKEFKQAKLKAAEILGVRILPSNLEIAEALDKIAEEKEGSSRQELLVQMRKEALQIMQTLTDFYPRLIGSVWRGTTHKNSDIDLVTFSQDHKTVHAKMKENNFKITKTEWLSVTKKGKKEASFHIYIVLPSNNEAEIIVKSLEKKDSPEKCEVYGDEMTGLSYHQLQKLLKEKPTQKFVPTR
jgi:predicted nucleotidyltransferase